MKRIKYFDFIIIDKTRQTYAVHKYLIYLNIHLE